jgi:Glycogen recognition site of AMP-activated protein kinase
MSSRPDERDPLEPAIDVLRRPVPVRAAWRAEVMSAVLEETAPRHRPRLTLHPGVAAAAAVALVVAGGAGTALLLRARDVGSTAVAVSAVDGNRPVTFTLEAPGAQRVALVGDFNGWDAGRSPLAPDADGVRWRLTLPLAPGRHVYAFVVDGGWRPDPQAARAPEDDFGSPNSVVLVAGRGSTR